MSSNISFEEMQIEVQDELIQLISEKVESSKIRFWKPSERTLTEDEMEKMYDIYNIFIQITHSSKKSRKTKFEIRIGRDCDLKIFGSGLDYKVECSLRSWGRSAATLLDSYFSTHYEKLFIGKLRFDLLTLDKENFAIPDFRLETNLFLYRNIPDANASHKFNDDEDPNRIPFESYVNDRLEDKLFLENFRAHLEQSKKAKN